MRRQKSTATPTGSQTSIMMVRVKGITALYEKQRKPSPVGKAAEAFAELGKAVAACGVNDKTIKPKSKKHKRTK